MLEYEISATRVDAHGSLLRCKQAEITCDTDVEGRTDAFNPAELLLAAIDKGSQGISCDFCHTVAA